MGEIGIPVEEEELPPEAHHTLFMSGLPLDMQKREATHIFRPFEGYKVRPYFLAIAERLLVGDHFLLCSWKLNKKPLVLQRESNCTDGS